MLGRIRTPIRVGLLATFILLFVVPSVEAQAFITQWAIPSSTHIAIDSADYLYISGGGRYLLDGTEALPGFSPTLGNNGLVASPDGILWGFDWQYVTGMVISSNSFPLGRFALPDVGDGEPIPGGLAVDGAQRIYVLQNEHGFDVATHEYYNADRVEAFSEFGPFYPAQLVLAEFDTHADGFGIAVDANGLIYVGDVDHNQIVVYSGNVPQGTFESTVVRTWGSPGSGPGQFNSPRGIALDPSGRVYVVDSGNHRVQVFNLDGGYLTSFGSQGSGPGQFSNPGDIKLDRFGNIYVVDSASRVEKFAALGGSTPVARSTWGALKARYR
jgi:sugar lactone lactonase YvrE